MKTILAVAAGGALGAVARHLVGLAAIRYTAGGYPWGTLAVNILGGLAMGMLVAAFALTWSVSQETRAFLTVGLMGGFTTFSAFSLEMALFIEKHQYFMAFSYAVISVLFALGALLAGLWLVRSIA